VIIRAPVSYETPHWRGSTSLSHCLTGGLAVEPLQQTLYSKIALYIALQRTQFVTRRM